MGCCSEFVQLGCVNYCAVIDTTYDATQTGVHTIEVSLGSDKWNVYNVSFTIGDDLTIVGTFVNEQGVHYIKIKQPDGTYYVFDGAITCLKFTTQIHYGQDNPAIDPPTLCYTDCDAIHDNVASEISAIDEKLVPAAGDWLIIEDAADSNNKKKVNIDNLPTPIATNTNIYNIDGTIPDATTRTVTGANELSTQLVFTDLQVFKALNVSKLIELNADYSPTSGQFLIKAGTFGEISAKGTFRLKTPGVNALTAPGTGYLGLVDTVTGECEFIQPDHTALSSIGTNTHAQIDTHIADTANPHSVTIDQVTPTTTKGDIIVENATVATRLAVGSNDQVLTADSTQATGVKWANNIDVIQLSCSDLTSDLTTGTSKAYFRTAAAFTVTDVRASVLTAPTGATLNVDINEGGVSILSTVITIDISEKTSTTAATPPVISDSSLADDAEITIDIDQVGSTVAGAGLIVTLIGKYT